MMSGENVEIVRRFNDAVTRGDREAVATLIHPEVDWRTMAGPLLGVDAVRGRDEVLSFIFDVSRRLRATTERFTELADDQVLVCGHYTGRGTTSRVEIEVPSEALYRFEEGMIVSFQDFPTEALAAEAARLTAHRRRIGSGRAPPLAATLRAAEAVSGHQPLHLAARDLLALAQQRLPGAAVAVGLVII